VGDRRLHADPAGRCRRPRHAGARAAPARRDRRGRGTPSGP
jgi:hypothetical protein